MGDHAPIIPPKVRCAISPDRIGSYQQAESEKKRITERPKLSEALAECKAMKATLPVAALSRMGSNRAEIFTLIDLLGVNVAFAAEPHASNLSIGIKAAMADDEGNAISYRTKAAVVAAKARGVKLRNPNGARALKRYIRALRYGDSIAMVVTHLFVSDIAAFRDARHLARKNGSRRGADRSGFTQQPV